MFAMHDIMCARKRDSGCGGSQCTTFPLCWLMDVPIFLVQYFFYRGAIYFFKCPHNIDNRLKHFSIYNSKAIFIHKSS